MGCNSSSAKAPEMESLSCTSPATSPEGKASGTSSAAPASQGAACTSEGSTLSGSGLLVDQALPGAQAQARALARDPQRAALRAAQLGELVQHALLELLDVVNRAQGEAALLEGHGSFPS